MPRAAGSKHRPRARERSVPKGLASLLLDLVMGHPALGRLRDRTLEGARGLVLELGVGTGRNLQRYAAPVGLVFGIDPDRGHLARAQPRARTAAVPAVLVAASAEILPLGDASVDAVVSTWCLCSIPDVARALGEVRRVLKPGAPFLFVEHGLCPEPGIAAWQHRLAPLWRRLAGGCNLDRPVAELIGRAGLVIERLETGHLVPGPRLLGWTYLGLARAPLA